MGGLCHRSTQSPSVVVWQVVLVAVWALGAGTGDRI
jgi:hypothetical protein